MRWVRARLWWLGSAARQPSLSRHLADLAGRPLARDLGAPFDPPFRLDLLGNPAAMIAIRGGAFACGWVGVAAVGRPWLGACLLA